ncbi:hypothetical protein AVEN_266496-1 [Araneus ventricosus]|uniref:Uncharacterized protein n=1 Tax=Araneus ventricosus TaxID=182803 RepID=A0A4Y2I4I0_ARAVE|nr:hypothetical protein AVEN_266496-1 [Araneus ventricosus]
MVLVPITAELNNSGSSTETFPVPSSVYTHPESLGPNSGEERCSAQIRFLDPEKYTVLRHPILMYISLYPPPDRGNSFCLVVKMLDSGTKSIIRFKTTHCHSGDPDVINATPTFSLTTIWQHQTK